MDPRLVSIAPEAYLGEALAAMIRDRTRQLVVMERDLPVGIVAFSDLVRSQSADSLMLIHDIADQNRYRRIGHPERRYRPGAGCPGGRTGRGAGKPWRSCPGSITGLPAKSSR
jgi:CBS domain-containing protein